MTEVWSTGRPYMANLTDKVEVEYRNGSREVAEVCEIDWSTPDDNDRYSCAPENEVVRYRLLPETKKRPPTG